MTTAQSAEQGTHFWHMTLQRGNHQADHYGTFTPKPTETRLDVFNWLYSHVTEKDPSVQDGVVLAFDIQPNQL